MRRRNVWTGAQPYYKLFLDISTYRVSEKLSAPEKLELKFQASTVCTHFDADFTPSDNVQRSEAVSVMAAK